MDVPCDAACLANSQGYIDENNPERGKNTEGKEVCNPKDIILEKEDRTWKELIENFKAIAEVARQQNCHKSVKQSVRKIDPLLKQLEGYRGNFRKDFGKGEGPTKRKERDDKTPSPTRKILPWSAVTSIGRTPPFRGGKFSVASTSILRRHHESNWNEDVLADQEKTFRDQTQEIVDRLEAMHELQQQQIAEMKKVQEQLQEEIKELKKEKLRGPEKRTRKQRRNNAHAGNGLENKEPITLYEITEEEGITPTRRTKQGKQVIPILQPELGVEPLEPLDLPTAEQHSGENMEWKKVSKRRKKKNLAKVTPDAVIVKCTENRTYADTLKNLKKNLNDAGLANEVATARETRDGNLLLQMRKRTTKTSHVKTIAESTTGVETQVRTTNVAVEIRGLDADVTKEELATEISSKTSAKMTSENVKAIKPVRGGKCTAVVLLPARVANELATGPRLRIGWAPCTIKIRIPMVRCTRCLDFGHRKRTCTGPDREATCLNCWETGHAKKDCSAEAQCGLCKEEGVEGSGSHYSGGGRCPTFRRFLESRRNKQ